MYTLVVIIHIIICLVLCVVVLLQSSKGGGLAGAFGGSGGMPQQVLGTRAVTTLLHKATIYCAAGFFVTSFTLFILTGDRSAGGRSSVIEEMQRDGTLTSDMVPEIPLEADPLQLPSLPAGDDAAPSTDLPASSEPASSEEQSAGGQQDQDGK